MGVESLSTFVVCYTGPEEMKLGIVARQIPAAGAGQVAIVLLSHLDPETGQYRVNVLQPMQGGCGARPTKDGIVRRTGIH